ncbi:NUDIX hydrolase domain-like protein [Vararia minispora EC-137]|uniref:NUDIX hydrolase domain-like protein n=1 Tax=Vararia minispora EC-137 TaxID=1314806 RepID=A0ACB8QMJ2_9AGAM|nr:NUDIX hydrolase domain-like protein [Vararia minispora EC-137]
MSGSPLNRLSWLRPSPVFLNALATHPQTSFILLRAGAPLTAYTSPTNRLVRLPRAAVQLLLGPDPLFGQLKDDYEGETKIPILESARFHGAPLVFLGVHETGSNDFPSSTDPAELALSINGTPYFTVDASEADEKEVERLLEAAREVNPGAKVSFGEARAAMRGMGAFDAGVFAAARSMVDWNGRNKFCAACGAPQYSLWAGWKLGCSSLLPWVDNAGRKSCPTATGLHNIAHPRTDGVVIMAVVNEANDQILLGHNKKFPGKFYSALAGFIEPGESFEDAVRREILEEAGIHVWNVRYHSTQPWPYPANLMVGFFATGDPAEPVRTDLDDELADARWFSRAEILTVLAHPEGTNMTRRDHARIARIIDGQSNVVPRVSGDAPLAGDAAQAQAAQAGDKVEKTAEEDDPLIRVPPETAIAGVLIADWAHGRFPAPQSAGAGASVKGNL